VTPPSIRATVSEPADPPPLSGARTSGLDFGVVGEPAGPGVAPTTPRDEQTFPEATTERRPTLCSTPERQRRLQSGRGLRGLRSAGPLFSQLPFPSDVGGFPICALSKGARWQGVARTVARIREAHPLSRPPPSLGRAQVRRRRETCHLASRFLATRTSPDSGARHLFYDRRAPRAVHGRASTPRPRRPAAFQRRHSPRRRAATRRTAVCRAGALPPTASPPGPRRFIGAPARAPCSSSRSRSSVFRAEGCSGLFVKKKPEWEVRKILCSTNDSEKATWEKKRDEKVFL